MTHEKAYNILKEYNKWRRGKGKKYASPGLPFDTKVIGDAIDCAVNVLKYQLTVSDFVLLVNMADLGHSIMKKSNTSNQYNIEALRNAKSIARKLVKKQNNGSEEADKT